MSAQSGQDQGADKNAYYILWVLALIGFVGGLIWYFFSFQLKTFFLLVRVYELWAIQSFLSLFSPKFPWFGPIAQQSLQTVSLALEMARSLNPSNLSMDFAEILSTTAGTYLRYPIGLYLIFLSFMVFKTNVQMRLKKKYDMQSLAIQEETIWPQIKITTKVDILNEDLDSGPWAMAMTPMQFAKKNKLVTVEFADRSSSQFAKMQAPEYKVTLNRVRAERAFSVQLGRTWQGVEAMVPHRRAIFAIFIARGNRDTKAALALVRQLAESGAVGQPDCSGADALWKKHIKTPRVKEICAQHAYEFTVFISALLLAREDGVVASADFLWVKPLDRRLWYVINNVGRQTPAVEVGGIFSHWYHEMALKQSLSAPRVLATVDALEDALSNIIYIPDEQEKQEIIKRQEAQKSAGSAAIVSPSDSDSERTEKQASL